MKSVRIECELASDGVLRLAMPLGAQAARTRVIVTVEPLFGALVTPSGDYGSCAGLGLAEPPDPPIILDSSGLDEFAQ